MIVFALLVIHVFASEFNQKYSDCVTEVGYRPAKEVDFICDRFKIGFKENLPESVTNPPRILCDLGGDFRANVAIGSPCNRYRSQATGKTLKNIVQFSISKVIYVLDYDFKKTNSLEPTTSPTKVLCDLGPHFRANVAIGSPCNQYNMAGTNVPNNTTPKMERTLVQKLRIYKKCNSDYILGYRHRRPNPWMDRVCRKRAELD